MTIADTSVSSLDPAFLAIQRARLGAMHRDLLLVMQRDADEALSLLSGRVGRQRMAIERALAKLDQGTYGISDVSGLPIPLGHLRAFPQATRTADEESRPAT